MEQLLKQNQDDGEKRLEELQDMLKGEHSDKMNAMKKLVEQQLRDEHAGVSNRIPQPTLPERKRFRRCFKKK